MLSSVSRRTRRLAEREHGQRKGRADSEAKRKDEAGCGLLYVHGGHHRGSLRTNRRPERWFQLHREARSEGQRQRQR